MIPVRLRPVAAGAAAGLVLSLAFPDSMGLWPLRLVANWPGALGRALGNLFAGGKFGPLALGQAPDRTSATSPAGRAAGVVLGLALQIAAACALVWLANQPLWARRFLAALAAAFAIAAMAPPSGLVTTAEVGGAIACAALAAVSAPESRSLALLLIAGVVGTTPLAELRPVFLGLGRAQGSVAVLETATGIAAAVFALLATAAFAGAVFFLLARLEPPAAAPASNPTPPPEPARVSPP